MVLDKISHGYEPALRWTLKNRGLTALGATVFFVLCAGLFGRLGSEFIPQLDEGSSAIQVFYPNSMSIEKAVERASYFEKTLMAEFPDEIDQVFTRIGRPEVATDPMFPSQHDAIITFKPQKGWKRARSNEELVEKFTEVTEKMPGLGTSYTQPVRMRMNELVEGVGIRSELGIKLYGDDLQVLTDKGEEIARVLRGVPGNADVSVEATEGLPMLNIDIQREAIARHGINVSDVQEVIEAAIGGSNVGTIVKGNAKFALTVRLEERFRRDPEAIGRITVPSSNGAAIPLAQLASINSEEGPIQISRENGSRRVVIQSQCARTRSRFFCRRCQTSGGCQSKIADRLSFGIRRHLRAFVVGPRAFDDRGADYFRGDFSALVHHVWLAQTSGAGLYRYSVRYHRRHFGLVLSRLAL